MATSKSNKPLCNVSGCDTPVLARGWCGTHYGRWSKTGDVQAHNPVKHKAQTLDHLVDKMGGNDACWLWLGSVSEDGYGRKRRKGKVVYTHRLAFELAYGPIPANLHVLHSCDTPPCVNPSHLFLGTQADNNRDRDRKGRHYQAAMTHCKRGHPLSGDNVHRQPSRPNKRLCRACIRAGFGRTRTAKAPS